MHWCSIRSHESSTSLAIHQPWPAIQLDEEHSAEIVGLVPPLLYFGWIIAKGTLDCWDSGVLLVLYLKKPGTDGHAPWLSYITGGGISTALPDTLMDDYAQSTFVPARAQASENWSD